MKESKNILGTKLTPCCHSPKTGFFRTGSCETSSEDHGVHTVCVNVTEEFLAFSKYIGNDLSTPHPDFGFPGLKPGDKWCVCASRWRQAADEGFGASIDPEATHERTLEYVEKDLLEKHFQK